ncbi:hypothetical protein SAMN04487911_13121 [Arenibacter nanhaiticus]|uniref:Uncharacterized protein n=1 Tax=Arenibacter nanhaiticus TaxID=558155 RepID=A0A1M6LFQ8_9FLAO|nr:hypothetical protein SAMN04487911_13121 [Arenibacter nanhaiticus]
MVLAPKNARKIIKKAASTDLFHYTEVSKRLLPAIAMIVYADTSVYPMAFKLFGGIMVITSLVLYFVPRKMHHQYALKCAEVLKPTLIRLLSPIAVLPGSLLIISVN